MNQNIILILSAVVLLILCIPNLLFKSPIKGKKDKILLVHGMVFLFLLVLVYYFLIIDVVNESFQSSSENTKEILCELIISALSKYNNNIYEIPQTELSSKDFDLSCLNTKQFNTLNLNNLPLEKYINIPFDYIEYLNISKLESINNLTSFNQIQLGNFLPEQIQSLTPTQLTNMDLNTFKALNQQWVFFTNEQLSILSNVIKKIPLYCDKTNKTSTCKNNNSIFFKVNFDKNITSLSNFNTSQLNYLIKNKIININNNPNVLNATLSYRSMKNNQLSINYNKISVNILNKISIINIKSLPASFIIDIGQKIVNLIPEQLNVLNKNQIRAITDINNLYGKIVYINAQYLTAAQIKSLYISNINSISIDSLQNFSIKNISALSKNQINALSCEKLNALNTRAIALGMVPTKTPLSHISNALITKNC